MCWFCCCTSNCKLTNSVCVCVCVCVCICACAYVRVRAQTCLTLWDPMDCSLLGSSNPGISWNPRILEQVAISSSRGSSSPRDQTRVSYISCIARWVLTTEPLGSPESYTQPEQCRNGVRGRERQRCRLGSIMQVKT